jgi:hypothetical protein
MAMRRSADYTFGKKTAFIASFPDALVEKWQKDVRLSDYSGAAS